MHNKIIKYMLAHI